LATAETSFVASGRRGKGGRVRSERDGAYAHVCVCVCVCARVQEDGTIGDRARQRERRGEVNKVPDMVSCDRRECYFTYTHGRSCVHACVRSHLPTLPTISSDHHRLPLTCRMQFHTSARLSPFRQKSVLARGNARFDNSFFFSVSPSRKHIHNWRDAR